MKATEQNICKALKISSDTYSEMMYEYGCAYLSDKEEAMIRDSGCVASQAKKFTNVFLHSKIWWNWWRREWQVVDRKFLRLEAHNMTDYKILQEGHAKIPPLEEVDMILDNHVILQDLSKAALILTDKQILNNDDSKSVLHPGRNQKIFS